MRNASPQDGSTKTIDAPPPAHQFYVPKSHARALNLNVPVVVGSRGAGKSFWWNALQSPDHRALIERLATDTRIKGNTRGTPGFGARPEHGALPVARGARSASQPGPHSARGVEDGDGLGRPGI